MKSRILFTDLDGTLLRDDKTISVVMKKALLQFLQAGNKLVLTSGRPFESIMEVKAQLVLPDEGVYVCAYNGGLIYDAAMRQILLQHLLSYDEVRYIEEKALSAGIHCQTYNDTAIISRAQTPELAYYQTHIRLPVIITQDTIGAMEHGPYKMLLIHLTDQAVLKQFRDSLYPWGNGKIAATFSNDKYLELFPLSSGKGNAVNSLCCRLGIPITDSIAAGDAENDISMLTAAGTGIAVKNAEEKVKEAADIVTAGDNNQDALLEIL